MSQRDARLEVVNDKWIEEEKRALSYSDILEQFFTRLERLNTADKTIEYQAAQNQERRMKLRRDTLEQIAQIQGNDEQIRTFLPDMDDPIIKLIDSAILFLHQLHAVARVRPAISPEMQVRMNQLSSALSIPPALIRSALIGIDWPIQDKITLLADLSLQRDFDICKPTSMEEDCSEDHNPA